MLTLVAAQAPPLVVGQRTLRNRLSPRRVGVSLGTHADAGEAGRASGACCGETSSGERYMGPPLWRLQTGRGPGPEPGPGSAPGPGATARAMWAARSGPRRLAMRDGGGGR